MPDQPTNNIWPLPKFYFIVEWGDGMQNASFQEISGLDTETQIIEYRHGDSKEFSTVRMPELAKTGTVTLKKGVFPKDNAFYDWFSTIKMNTIQRQTVTIKLLDESGAPAMVCTLQNAFPTKIMGTDLNSEGSEVAVETIELAYEGLSIKNGD